MVLSLACVTTALQPFFADMDPIIYRVVERKMKHWQRRLLMLQEPR